MLRDAVSFMIAGDQTIARARRTESLYGGVDALNLVELARPVPESDQILIRVSATGINKIVLRL